MSTLTTNLRAFALTGLGCGSYVALTAIIGKKKVLPERLSRKLMHIGEEDSRVYSAPPFQPFSALTLYGKPIIFL